MNRSSIHVRALSRAERRAPEPEVRALEAGVSYPLGNDRFTLDHGDDYFAFFERLGDLEYLAAFDRDSLVGVAAFVLRALTDGPAWYVGDLKVRPDRRGEGIAARLLAGIPPAWHLRCDRCFAVSMNPGDGRANPVAEQLTRTLPLTVEETLAFYSFDEATMRELQPLVERHRGAPTFLSLRGTKDLVLVSTGRPMPLFHVQFGLFSERGLNDPQPGALHMLATPQPDDLAIELTHLGHEPTATASVLAARMSSRDWSFLLSSDI